MPVFRNLVNPNLMFGAAGHAFHQGFFESSDKEVISLLKKTEDFRNGNVVEAQDMELKPSESSVVTPPEGGIVVGEGEQAPAPQTTSTESDAKENVLGYEEVKAELDKLGVAYNRTEKKVVLMQLLESAKAAMKAPTDETNAPTTGTTGSSEASF